jgi:hypothetical protein
MQRAAVLVWTAIGVVIELIYPERAIRRESELLALPTGQGAFPPGGELNRAATMGLVVMAAQQ